MRSFKHLIAAGILAAGMGVLGAPGASAQSGSPPVGDYGQDYGSDYSAPNYAPPNYNPSDGYAPSDNGDYGPVYDEAYSPSEPPPSCPYGYYPDYPYTCAPYGYWGPQYFYNGIFVGVGPWFGWGWGPGFVGYFHNFGYFRNWGGFTGARFRSLARSGQFHGSNSGGFHGGAISRFRGSVPAARDSGGFRGSAPAFHGAAPALRGGEFHSGSARGGGFQGGGFRGGSVHGGGFRGGGRHGGGHGGGHR